MGIYTIGGFINSAQNETLVSPTDPMPQKPQDDSGNTLLPAFSPGTTYQLTATAADQALALGSANAVQIIGDQTAAARVRLLFGVATDTVSDTVGLVVRVLDPARSFYVPLGATHLHYIRDAAEAADVLINVTLG